MEYSNTFPKRHDSCQKRFFSLIHIAHRARKTLHTFIKERRYFIEQGRKICQVVWHENLWKSPWGVCVLCMCWAIFRRPVCVFCDFPKYILMCIPKRIILSPSSKLFFSFCTQGSAKKSWEKVAQKKGSRQLKNALLTYISSVGKKCAFSSLSSSERSYYLIKTSLLSFYSLQRVLASFHSRQSLEFQFPVSYYFSRFYDV